jgi:hypothetical protein
LVVACAAKFFAADTGDGLPFKTNHLNWSSPQFSAELPREFFYGLPTPPEWTL